MTSGLGGSQRQRRHGGRGEDDDLTTISNIDLEKVNNVLKHRYAQDNVYTYSGSILISVNPYKELPFTYDEDVMGEYSGGDWRVLAPHIYAIAESAYVSLKRTGVDPAAANNQSIVISGESGAGKTETTKFVLNYLCHITSNVSTWVEHQILEANTILEAFGNAKTVRNDNSSRFGKFMRVCFDSRWMIRGCVIQDYLLEQSRITFQAKHERNYHVFYHITRAARASAEVAQAYGVDAPAGPAGKSGSYAYLRCDSEEDLSPCTRDFDSLRLAFNVLQIPGLTADGIFRVVSAVLGLGNLSFAEEPDSVEERCVLDGGAALVDKLAELLGISSADLGHILLTRQINVRGNITEIPLKLSEANENRHAMAKALYSKTFQWLVAHINTCTNPGNSGGSVGSGSAGGSGGQQKFIGILDIFGFENFEENSFEQFCINYTNEKLQKFFNNYVFAIEQDIYKSEGLVYSHIEFTDNSLCLELIEKPPRCLLKLLTEQCHLPKGSDCAYLSNITAEFRGVSLCFDRPDDRRAWGSEFRILHYAGPVTYRVKGFVDKNRDVQQDLFFHYLSESKNLFVRDMVNLAQEEMLNSRIMVVGSGGGGDTTTLGRSSGVQQGQATTTTSKCKPTVSEAFRVQLGNLVDVLQSTTPWYVRCIKPNMSKLPDGYDSVLVKDQLGYLGMLEIIRIRREGYPVHYPFAEFVKRFKVVGKFRTYPPPKDIAKDILRPYPVKEWQLGLSKVFLRHSVYECLETLRLTVLNRASLVVQSFFRSCHVRRGYLRKRSATVVVQRYYRTYRERLLFLRKRRAAVVLQTYLRGMFAREVAQALREMRRVQEAIMEEEGVTTPEGGGGGGGGGVKQEFANLIQMLKETGGGGGDQIEMLMMSPASSVACVSGIFETDEDDEERGGGETSTEVEEEEEELTSAAALAARGFGHQEEEEEEESPSPPPLLPPPSVVEMILPPPVAVVVKKAPTLPEPTVPPPPPPQQQKQEEQEAMAVGVADKKGPPAAAAVVAPPPMPVVPKLKKTAKKGISKKGEEEPIYESIQPKIDPRVLSLTSSSAAAAASSRAPPPVPATGPPEQQQQQLELHHHRSHFIKSRLEALQQSTPVATEEESEEAPPRSVDLLTFAVDYFNDWEKPTDLLFGVGKPKQYYSKEEMTCHTRSTSIPSSHLHLYDPSNVKLAVQIFHDTQKFIRSSSDNKSDQQSTTSFLQSLIRWGLDREELRDEIYVTVVRLISGNESLAEVRRLYFILCLLVVSFPPSKTFLRVLLQFLNKNHEDINVSDQVAYIKSCLKRSTDNNGTGSSGGYFVRSYPPSSVEIQATQRLGTLVVRVFFPDGRSKAIDVHPTDTAADAVQKLAREIGMTSGGGGGAVDGSYALYESNREAEVHVAMHTLVYDVIAKWELQMAGNSKMETRFLFKKRLFRAAGSREIPQDPVQVDLLFAQATHSVVKVDAYPISEKVALQLAGLHMQATTTSSSSSAEEPLMSSAVAPETLLPQRLLRVRPHGQWVQILAQAHKQYGQGKSALVAKVWYLSCVMQYPLYGTSLFHVLYRGYWLYGNTLLLGVSCEGVSMIKPDDKFVMYEYSYDQIESVDVEAEDVEGGNNLTVTVTLTKAPLPPDSIKCFVFETPAAKEVASLIRAYHPPLANSKTGTGGGGGAGHSRVATKITNRDRWRLHESVVSARRMLVQNGVLKKGASSSNLIKNTLRRFKRDGADERGRGGSMRKNSSSGSGPGPGCAQAQLQYFADFPVEYFSFSKCPISTSLSYVSDAHVDAAVASFTILLNYAGVSSSAPQLSLLEEETASLLQSLLEKVWKVDELVDELYLQLVKQTTDFADPNGKVNGRNWAALALLASLVPPTNPLVRKYLHAHLKKCGADSVTSEGKFARFAEKCLLSSCSGEMSRRQWSPSRQEILCTVNMRPITARFHLMDGKHHTLSFTPNDTAGLLLRALMTKVGLTERASGYSLYELGSVNGWERSLLSSERPVEVMARWEKQRATNGALQFKFVMKKHLFVDIDLADPVEKELVYHQLLHQARSDRFPVSETEAAMLVALQAQVELGDYATSSVGEFPDYCHVSSHCLPTRIAASVSHEAVARHHQSLVSTHPTQAKQAVLNLLRSWPLHKAAIFDVTQSFTSNWPRGLWLAVDEGGVHLLQQRTRHTLCSFEYETIVSYSPSPTCFMLVTSSDHQHHAQQAKPSKIVLNTQQGFQVSQLIKEYIHHIYAKRVSLQQQQGQR